MLVWINDVLVLKPVVNFDKDNRHLSFNRSKEFRKGALSGPLSVIGGRAIVELYLGMGIRSVWSGRLLRRHVMSHRIQDMEGIGPQYGQKLMNIGISTVEKLLELGCERRGREEIVLKTGISSKMLMDFVNMADLYRIKGVGSEYAELLEEAGVDTVVELAHRRPDHLHRRMIEVNEHRHLVRSMPSQHQVEGWIRQAKNLPRKIHH